MQNFIQKFIFFAATKNFQLLVHPDKATWMTFCLRFKSWVKQVVQSFIILCWRHLKQCLPMNVKSCCIYWRLMLKWHLGTIFQLCWKSMRLKENWIAGLELSNLKSLDDLAFLKLPSVILSSISGLWNLNAWVYQNLLFTFMMFFPSIQRLRIWKLCVQSRVSITWICKFIQLITIILNFTNFYIFSIRIQTFQRKADARAVSLVLDVSGLDSFRGPGYVHPNKIVEVPKGLDSYPCIFTSPDVI